jgi:hypothetical protein
VLVPALPAAVREGAFTAGDAEEQHPKDIEADDELGLPHEKQSCRQRSAPRPKRPMHCRASRRTMTLRWATLIST